MGNETIAALRQNWPAILGWAIFIALMIALAAGHYVFNPFIFGFAYYVGFVISQAAKSKENQDAELMSRRLFGVCLICVLYLVIAFRNEYDRDQFIRNFERTCYRSRYADFEETRNLCNELHSHIDNHLTPTLDDSDE